MIGLALAIVLAWLLLESGGFVLGLLLAAFARWKEERDMLRALRWWESLTVEDQAPPTHWPRKRGEHPAGLGCSPSGASPVMRYFLRSIAFSALRVPIRLRSVGVLAGRAIGGWLAALFIGR